MTKVICLCGASGSGKTMLSEAYVNGQPQRSYIRTTTAQVRERLGNPSYEYLMSREGYNDMITYQNAIADNLWNQLFHGVNDVNEGEYHIAILDRSPMDAYLYEAIYSLNSLGILWYGDQVVSPAMWAYRKTLEEYKKRSSLQGTEITIVGLTSLFESNDPKRPPSHVNVKYRHEVINAFAIAKHTLPPKTRWLKFVSLPNSRLEIEGRVHLLNAVINEKFK